MRLWVIVPVRGFASGKSRLAGAVSAAVRQQLNEAMLRRVLRVLRGFCGGIGVMVVTPSFQARYLARALGFAALRETPGSTLNEALSQATCAVRRLGADTVLILPSDLPFLAVADVRRVMSGLGVRRGVVIGPDRHGDGTNALAFTPVSGFRYRFGRGSFSAHVREARRARSRLRIVRTPGIAFDVDTPDDYRAIQSRPVIAMPASGIL
jgi:2-phospho-L-lactate/phosphoenolpyruvate guanylyltransferase